MVFELLLGKIVSITRIEILLDGCIPPILSFSKKHIKSERRLKLNDVVIKFCPLKSVKKSGIRIEHRG